MFFEAGGAPTLGYAGQATLRSRQTASPLRARFRLVMAKDSSVHECVVAWIQQNRIGLTFTAAPNAEAK
jgi:hypothetical protein